MSSMQLEPVSTHTGATGSGTGMNAVAAIRRQPKTVRYILFVFPLLLHFWPLLLVVSQKALTPLGLLLAIPNGTRQFQRDLLVALSMLALGALTLLLQPPNEYALAHYIGYALFVLSVPLINTAVRNNSGLLIEGLALLSIFNSLLAFAVYFLAIDLSAFRGLNRIIGTDDTTHRVYYETASLLAVFSVHFIRPKILRWVCFAIVAAYALLLARSVFVILLFLINQYLHRAVYGSLRQRVAAISTILVIAAAGPLVTMMLRSDLELSLGIKLLQFNAILEDTSPAATGSGWGYVIDTIVNSPDQEYQVEMQLPMLFRQIGLVGVVAYAVGIFLLMRSISVNFSCAALRWLTYMAIGFNNPWLLIPSWYMTTCLMYPELNRKTS